MLGIVPGVGVLGEIWSWLDGKLMKEWGSFLQQGDERRQRQTIQTQIQLSLSLLEIVLPGAI